ncbi:hypothetical protein BGW80DRAFT_1461935 [Lactifluus volemus]|nr:hypothetical protein BGW80DRAFT_1461935 [Lactifluus volemus]
MSSPPLSPSPFSPSLKLGNLGSTLWVASRKQAEMAIARSSNLSTPSVAPPQPSGSQDKADTNSQDFSPPVFTGTPISQPSSTPKLIPPQQIWLARGDHLMANIISAQKAEDGKISWVEFTPPYHAHLVKCAVALVPHPLQKVKKVMFTYVLDTLNREAPKAFFNLTKGPSLALKAQKEKKRLAWKRNRTSRQQCWAAEEAATGKSQHACKECRSPTAPPTFKVNPPPTTPLEAAKQCTPKTAVVAAGPATFFEQPNVETPPACHSNWLNTAAKRGMRQRVMESVIDKP